MQAGAVCKTVGSAYVGSNPTPATTCENGPLAAETRPGGPFRSCHAMYQRVSLRVDARQWLRTYSGQRPGGTSGSYNRSLRRSGGRTGVVNTSVACRSPAAEVRADATAAGMISAVAAQLVNFGVAGTTKSTTPCVFCGTAGSLSDEHVVPKWLRKALQIREQVREFSGTAYVGAAETLAIAFHDVCVSCNRG